jgi:predicted transcriptional regulator
VAGEQPRFWGFREPRALLDGALGALERRVLAIAWRQGEVSVRDVCERLEPSTAYTTVMTTLDRLFKKGLLGRAKRGRAFLYRAALSREELDRRFTAAVVEGALERSEAAALPILSALVETVGECDRRLLDDLERLVREKRKALSAGERCKP